MDNLAVHMRISNVSPSDDDVNSRRAAVTSLATKWRKERTLLTILSKAANIADTLGGNGIPSPDLGNEIQTAIQKRSSSYLYEERPLEISICSGMAMVSILDSTPGGNGWSTADVYATALWSSLAYQPVLETERRENLRQEVLDKARHWVVTSAERSRERKDVPDPAVVDISIDEDNFATNNFKEAVAGTIVALRSNAVLDREELDFLWWAQLGRSRLLKRQLSSIDESTRIVAAGIEGASMLRRLPCEVHRDIVLRTLDQDPELDLAEMIEALGEDRAILGAPFNEGQVKAYPTIFPFLYALATGEVQGAGATVKRRVSEWGSRALLEAGFAKILSQGLGKL